MFRAERLGRDAAGRLFAGDWFHCAPDGGNDRQIPAKKVEVDWAASGRGAAGRRNEERPREGEQGDSAGAGVGQSHFKLWDDFALQGRGFS